MARSEEASGGDDRAIGEFSAFRVFNSFECDTALRCGISIELKYRDLNFAELNYDLRPYL